MSIPISKDSLFVNDFINVNNVFVSPNHEYYYFKDTLNLFELNQNDSIEIISETLNRWLEKKILNNPNQWIWSHNRWK